MADIELVIKIPEEMYNNGQLVKFFGCYSKKLDEAIYTGTQLPQGHGRLIDADLYVKRMREISAQQKYNKLFSDNVLSVNDIFEAVISELTGESLDGYKNAPTVVEADGGDVE